MRQRSRALGTRCNTALTVVSTISGVSSAPPRCSASSASVRHAAGDDFGIWRHPVVRNAVPGWEAQALHFGGEELKRVFQRREPLAVAGDMQDRLAGLAAREMAGERAEHRGIEPFGHAACDRRAAVEQPRDGQAFRCRRFGHGQSLAAFDAA